MYSKDTIALCQQWLAHDNDDGPIDYSYLLADCFDLQKEYILSPARRKVAVTGRRAGKTVADVYYMFYVAMSNPGCNVGYATKTRQWAKDLAWRRLVNLCHEYDVGAKVNTTELTIELSNQSIIRLAGCQDIDEADKLRGFPFLLVILDEVESVRPEVLRYLLEDVLAASLADYKGTLACTGTPHPSCSGYLYDIDKGKDKDKWAHWHWTMADNPRFPQWSGKANWQALAKIFIQEELIELCLDINDPVAQREYFGLWVKSLDDFILHIDDTINIYSPASPEVPRDLQYVLGIDLGFNDESAFVINGYSRYTQKVYHITDIAHPRLPMGDIIAIAQGFIQRYNPVKIVVDPATGGQFLVEELRRRHNFPCIAAHKTEKAAYFRLWNADIRAGRYLFLPPVSSKLIEQAKALQWDERYMREREGIPCDLADAALYSWRECYHYLPKIEPEKPMTLEERIWQRTLNKYNEQQADTNLLLGE